MGPTEYGLLALVILVPLAIASAVTLWSLEQVRYRPKRRRPRPATAAANAGAVPPPEPGAAAGGGTAESTAGTAATEHAPAP